MSLCSIVLIVAEMDAANVNTVDSQPYIYRDRISDSRDVPERAVAVLSTNNCQSHDFSQAVSCAAPAALSAVPLARS